MEDFIMEPTVSVMVTGLERSVNVDLEVIKPSPLEVL